MKIRDLDPILVSTLKITFDEDPHTGTIDVIVPVETEHFSDVLGPAVLDMDIYLMEAQGDTLVISTFTRNGD